MGFLFLRFSIYEFHMMAPVSYFKGDSELHLRFKFSDLRVVLEVIVTFTEITRVH